ncbi:MAG: hypothetical protein A2W31_07780 [Planctomycetes bacterium RBG_16_64_10]|nr:MAG: hypothetical protein A2W31_07780 [Planctomycetes bacterium RBG_16_64_10]
MKLLVTSTVLATVFGMPQTVIQQPDADLMVYSAVQELPDLTPSPDDAEDEGPSDTTGRLTPPPDDAENEGPSDV